MSQAGSDVILQRMMALHPKLIDLTLDRVWRLLDALENPQDKLPPVIHIAGTNGKGSTLAMIRAGLEASGHLVHAYTSPHLARFHERIRLAGELIDEPNLAEVLDECYKANGPEPITYFEITTVAAILAFSRVRADYCLLEVGLGGRLDATNIIEKPRATVITPVSLDHQQFLGDTLPKIASEKAGILKRGVTCVVSRQHEAGLEVIEAQASKLGAPLLAYGQHWHVEQERDRLVYQDETGLCDLPLPNLPGVHQIENAGAALAVLRNLGLDTPALEAAVTNANWPARMQRLKTGPLVNLADGAQLWLDGGHNPAAGSAIAAHLSRGPKVYLICGMLNTKDVAGYMEPLKSCTEAFFSVSIPGESATLSADETAEIASQVGIPSQSVSDIETAISKIVSKDQNARILICGSLYLAGHVLRSNG